MNSIDNLKNASSPYKKEREEKHQAPPLQRRKRRNKSIKLLPLLRGRLGGGKLLN
jgi:hypothetical protein